MALATVKSLSKVLYQCYKDVKANKKRCARLVERVKPIEGFVDAVTDKHLDNPLVKSALTKLKEILTSAVELVKKHGHCDQDWLMKAMEANSMKSQFYDLNIQLSEVSGQLSLCLQLEQLNKLEQLERSKRREEEDECDGAEDEVEWQRVLEGMNKTVNNIQRDVNDVQSGQIDLKSGQIELKNSVDYLTKIIKGNSDTVDRGSSEPNSQLRYMDVLRMEKSSGPPTPSPAASTQDADKLLGEVRGKFVEKASLPLIKQLLDGLQEERVLNSEEAEAVLEEQAARADRARCLIDMVRKKGPRASQKMITLLRERDPTLGMTLGLG